MAAKRKNEIVNCKYFQWIVTQRDGVFYADGRSNSVNVGRNSLATRDREEALRLIEKLDLHKAVEQGFAERTALEKHLNPLDLDEGRRLFEEHNARPRILKGIKPTSEKRYRAVLDKFIAFAKSVGLRTWNQIDTAALKRYAKFLEGEDYAYATVYLELTTLKSVVKWLKRSGHLESGALIDLTLDKPQGTTTTYCWRPEEVQAMIEWCKQKPELHWQHGVIVALACTGLRISEVASLRWSDVDLEANRIQMTDESKAAKIAKRDRRETKSGRSRSLPIHPDLAEALKQIKKSKDGLIFHGPLGGRLKPDTFRYSFIRDVLKPLQKRFPNRSRGGNGFSDGRVHSFRHYFNTVCAQSGVPLVTVMEWLGHIDSKMTKHYFHLHDQEEQQQMKRLNFLGGTPGDVAREGGSEGGGVGGEPKAKRKNA